MNTGYHDLRAVHKWAIGPTIATSNLISITKNATFSFASIEKD